MFGRKGDLDLELPTTDYDTGDTVTGRVHIRPEKEITAKELWIEFSAARYVTEYTSGSEPDGSGGSSQTVAVPFHTERVVLREHHTYLPGHDEVFDFAFEIPEPVITPPEPKGDGIVARITFSRARSSYRKVDQRYHVTGRLDARGRDLKDSVTLTVNGGG